MKKLMHRVLIVDDQEFNLLFIKAKIENTFPEIQCNHARSGEEALKMFKNNKFDLILMDIQMPGIGGIEAAKQIKNLNPNQIIIALSAIGRYSFFSDEQNLAKKINVSSLFDGYVSKAAGDNFLFRCLDKFLSNLNNHLELSPNQNELFLGKKLLLTDDNTVDRAAISNFLKSYGFEVFECESAKEMLQIYQQSLNNYGFSEFDLLLVDIFMSDLPDLNGDKAVMLLRKIEIENKIDFFEELPIIAVSGNEDQENISSYLRCGISDYFSKSQGANYLLLLIYNLLSKKESRKAQKIDEKSNQQKPKANLEINARKTKNKIFINSSPKQIGFSLNSKSDLKSPYALKSKALNHNQSLEKNRAANSDIFEAKSEEKDSNLPEKKENSEKEIVASAEYKKSSGELNGNDISENISAKNKELINNKTEEIAKINENNQVKTAKNEETSIDKTSKLKARTQEIKESAAKKELTKEQKPRSEIPSTSLRNRNYIDSSPTNSSQIDESESDENVFELKNFVEIEILDQSKLANFGQIERKHLITLFFESCDFAIDSVDRAISKKSQKDLTFSIHSMKGICANIGAKRALAYISRAEIIFETQPQRSVYWIVQFKKLYEELKNEFKKLGWT